MWDDSLPVYDGSLEHNFIVFTLYFRVALYYLISLLGLITLLVLIISPIIGLCVGLKSIKVEIKKKKVNKLMKKKKQKEEDFNQTLYLNQLNTKLKKKRKHE